MAAKHDGDPLGTRLDRLKGADPDEDLMSALATGTVLVLLARPPGEGANRPERNLVEWKRAADGLAFVPLFSASERLPGAVRAPQALTRVATRVLLSVVEQRQCILNPLSPTQLVLTPSLVDELRATLHALSIETRAPSPQVPWGFRLPPEDWYGVAYALADWIIQDGRLTRAFLYEVLYGEAPPQVVLGLEIPTDVGLAAVLRNVAESAGAPPGALVVRFLPDEPSHAQGVYGMGISPFYERAVQ